MGGCATKPKDLIAKAALLLPTAKPDHPQPLESKNEEPLLEVSGHKEEGGAENPAEPEAANVEALPKEVAQEVKPAEAEDKATEPVAAKAEDKATEPVAAKEVEQVEQVKAVAEDSNSNAENKTN